MLLKTFKPPPLDRRPELAAARQTGFLLRADSAFCIQSNVPLPRRMGSTSWRRRAKRQRSLLRADRAFYSQSNVPLLLYTILYIYNRQRLLYTIRCSAPRRPRDSAPPRAPAAVVVAEAGTAGTEGVSAGAWFGA